MCLQLAWGGSPPSRLQFAGAAPNAVPEFWDVFFTGGAYGKVGPPSPNPSTPPPQSTGLNLEIKPNLSTSLVNRAKVTRSPEATEVPKQPSKAPRPTGSLRRRFAFGQVSKEDARSTTAKDQRVRDRAEERQHLASKKQRVPDFEQQGLVPEAATEVDVQPRSLGPGPSFGTPSAPGVPSSPGPSGPSVLTSASASGPWPPVCPPAQEGPRPSPPRHNLCGQATAGEAQPTLQPRAEQVHLRTCTPRFESARGNSTNAGFCSGKRK